MRGGKQVLFNLVESLLDDDLPDGAWLQMIQDLIDSNKKQFGVTQDTHDLLCNFIETRRN